MVRVGMEWLLPSKARAAPDMGPANQGLVGLSTQEKYFANETYGNPKNTPLCHLQEWGAGMDRKR